MTLDSKQLRAIAARFRLQHALELLAKGAFAGLASAALFILFDKIWPLSLTFDPGWPALGIGFGIGVVAGLIGLARRFAQEDAARAVDAHYALMEQVASAREFATPSTEFEAALVNETAAMESRRDLVRDFRLRPPRYTSRAASAGAFAVALMFLPPLGSLLPEKRAEMAELKERQAQLEELSRDLKEIKRDDPKLEELSEELQDLAVRAQKQRLNKEDFLKELDEIQKQLEAQRDALTNKNAAEALKNLDQAIEELVPKDVSESDLAAKLESLKSGLANKQMRFDELEKLQSELKAQEKNLEGIGELEKLKDDLNKMREEALKQQEEKLGGEIDRLLSELRQETNDLSPKTPSELQQELKQEANQLQQEKQQNNLDSGDLAPMKEDTAALKQSDPQSSQSMSELLNKLQQALQKQGQVGEEKAACQNPGMGPKQAGKEGQAAKEGQQGQKQGERSNNDAGQEGQNGQNGDKGQQDSGKPGQGEKGQQGQEGQQGSSGQQPGAGQQSVQDYIDQQGGAQNGGNQGGQPMDSPPQMGGQAQSGQSNGGSGSSSSFSSMSKNELEDWSKLLEQYKGLDAATNKVGQCRGGGGEGGNGSGGSAGGSGWGLGKNSIGSRSDQGAGEAPDAPGADTKQSTQTLMDEGEFQAVYDPHLANIDPTDDSRVAGIIGEGESGGVTMIKAPETEEGDAVTPHFDVSPEVAEAEVEALEDQDIPASLKDYIRLYFEEVGE